MSRVSRVPGVVHVLVHAVVGQVAVVIISQVERIAIKIVADLRVVDGVVGVGVEAHRDVVEFACYPTTTAALYGATNLPDARSMVSTLPHGIRMTRF